jgi:hypothetical protein
MQNSVKGHLKHSFKIQQSFYESLTFKHRYYILLKAEFIKDLFLFLPSFYLKFNIIIGKLNIINK